MMALSVHDKKYELKTESHLWQRRNFWPKEGKHILAQFDDDTVVVYQAFRPSIAEYAVKNQRFGGSDFSFERMSWIKPNFLWMMYRSGWARKPNQERILAVRILREGFQTILANAYTASLQKSKKLSNQDIMVRLQWDPDHTPCGDKVARRAIQLGLKGQILERYGTEWVVCIEDVTPMVKQQYDVLVSDGEESLITPSERVYPVTDTDVAACIELDKYGHDFKRDSASKPQMLSHTQSEAISVGATSAAGDDITGECCDDNKDTQSDDSDSIIHVDSLLGPEEDPDDGERVVFIPTKQAVVTLPVSDQKSLANKCNCDYCDHDYTTEHTDFTQTNLYS